VASFEQLDIDDLFRKWSGGDRTGLDELFPQIQGELHKMARRYMRSERSGHTLQTTALVNELFLKLAGSQNVSWQNRAHFFAIAAHAMRLVLVDHARSVGRVKRGGGNYRLELDESCAVTQQDWSELIDLHLALEKLAKIDSRKSRVVELRYFGGLEVREVADVLRVSPNTVIRDWRLAKAWLRRELER
jgi:RNA polymerase sigma-70 factor (ECF subfamily)